MPTYDYLCEACNHAFELFQSITAPVQRKCPHCGKSKLQRLIGTGAGVLFKGGGFYETDYRSDSYKKAAEADKKAAEPASSKDSKADKKPTDAPVTKAEPAAKEPKPSKNASAKSSRKNQPKD